MKTFFFCCGDKEIPSNERVCNGKNTAFNHTVWIEWNCMTFFIEWMRHHISYNSQHQHLAGIVKVSNNDMIWYDMMCWKNVFDTTIQHIWDLNIPNTYGHMIQIWSGEREICPLMFQQSEHSSKSPYAVHAMWCNLPLINFHISLQNRK